MRITKKIAERLELVDDATEYGGKSYSDEKLDNFMAECQIPFGSSLRVVNDALAGNGLLPFSRDDVNAVIDQLKGERTKKKMTSAELAATLEKTSEMMSKAYVMALNAIKRVVKEHGGHIDILCKADIINDLTDHGELIPIYSCFGHDDFHWLYGLQIGHDGCLEFLAVDPVERKGVVLQNQCLDYDIQMIAAALQCELEQKESVNEC